MTNDKFNRILDLTQEFDPMIHSYEKHMYKDHFICLYDFHEDDDSYKEDWGVVDQYGKGIYGARSPYGGRKECERFVDHLESGKPADEFKPYVPMSQRLARPDSDKS